MATVLEWQGRVGAVWADKAEAHDQLLGPVGEVGIDTLAPLAGKRVLDLGCGAGATSLAMAALGAKVLGVDISTDLLAKARLRDAERRCDFQLADASNAAFETPFDALYSRCGAMFFTDPVAGWAHLRTQMKPGARATIVCWREAVQNEWAVLPLQAAASVLGDEMTKPSPSGVAGPFAWADVDVFTEIFDKSGWSDLQYQAVDREVIMACGDDPDPIQRGVEFAMTVGPLGSRVRNLPPESQTLARAALADGLRAKLRDGAVRISTAAWVITVTA